MLQHGARVVGSTAGLALGTSSAYGYYYVTNEFGEEAVGRTLSFYQVAVPAFVAYKSLEFQCEKLPSLIPSPLQKYIKVDEEDFETLHRRWAPRFLDKYLELRGWYLKGGQAIANNVADLFPKIWQDAMEPILDNVPPIGIEKVWDIVRQEGVDFDFIEAEPIGSASIGQVHRARWQGKDVVVKVQYPEVEKTFRGDVFAVKRLCQELFPQYYVAFEEIERQFATEFDYRGEAKNSEDIRRKLPRKFHQRIQIPQVYYATKRLLVMEEVKQCETLKRALTRMAQLEAKRRGFGDDLKKLAEDEQEKDAVAAREGRLVTNAWWSRWLWRLAGGYNTHQPASLVDLLLDVHGHQVLIDGCFHGDCHPGNVLLTPRHLALVDFGQVKRIDRNTRIQLAKILLLVDAAIKTDPRSGATDPVAHEKARHAVARAMVDAGFETQHNDVDVIYEMASCYFGRDDRVWIYPKNFQQWTEEIQSRDPVKNLSQCEDFVFVVRCAMLLRGLGHMIHEHRNLATAWKPYAVRVLRESGDLESIHRTIRSFSS